jgi:transforming growth factor-beta-induced protein
MRAVLKLRSVLLLLVLALVAGACGSDAADDTASEGAVTDTASDASTDASTDAAAGGAAACDADAIVAAVEGGAEEGTLAGMADDPVGTAASSNPVLTTLVTAVSAAGLVDTLNSAEALTVFAPTDCAFAALDPATLEAALADPQGLLTNVLGLHVIAGERIASADLAGEYANFAGSTTPVEGGAVGGGASIANRASIVVPDIMTANATVHLIDAVLLPAG